MRYFLILLLQIGIFIPGPAQNQARVWIFGQGIGLDFNHSPTRTLAVPWQPSSANFEHDVNQSTVHCDENGRLVLYFLNGHYYDENYNLIHSIPNYYYARGYGNGSGGSGYPTQTSAFKKISADTLLHIYLSGVPPNTNVSWFTHESRIHLNRIVKSNNGWSFTAIDSFPRGGIDSNEGIMGLNIYDHAPTNRLLIFLNRSVNLNPPTIVKDILMVTNNGFTLQPHAINRFFFNALIGRGFYHPLTEIFYVPQYGRNGTGNMVDSLYLARYKLSANNQLTQVGAPFPLVSPADSGTNFYIRNRQMWSSAASLQGRYLFIYTSNNNVQQEASLIRYDLFASNSNEFIQNTVDLNLPPGFNSAHRKIADLQAGPDGHVYFLESHGIYNLHNSVFNVFVGRIENADSAKASSLNLNMRYVRFPDYAVYKKFPGFLSSQLMPPPFNLISNCQDSVYFDLNYKTITDSVWWDFGAPALGQANHSTSKQPVVSYPGYGTYPVSVELWWRGNLIRTLYDTIEVEPVPKVELPADTILCAGDSLNINVSQGFEASYLWNTASTDSLFTIRNGGTYIVEVSTNCGNASDTIVVEFRDFPQKVLSDTTICEKDTAHFTAFYLPDAVYKWSNGSNERTIGVTDSGWYEVEISNYCDTIYDRAKVTAEKCGCRIHIPTAFSPNGDGLNDHFEIKSDCEVLEFELQIFNRWGSLVYQQNQDQPFWDGKINGAFAKGGVYIYTLIYEGYSAKETIQGKKTGYFTLVR